MDMLHHVKYLAIILIFFFSSCSEKVKDDNALILKSYSVNIIGGEKIYRTIHLDIDDTLKKWKKEGLFGGSVACNYSSFYVDSLLCFNKEKNKMITVILESGCKEDYGDGLHFLNGVNINAKWYFFRGPYIFLLRERYHSNDIHTPLSFEQLHAIAMKEVFSGYLKKNPQGQWEVNEHFFDGISKYDAYNYPFTTQESYDESVLRLVRANWEKRK